MLTAVEVRLSVKIAMIWFPLVERTYLILVGSCRGRRWCSCSAREARCRTRMDPSYTCSHLSHGLESEAWRESEALEWAKLLLKSGVKVASTSYQIILTGFEKFANSNQVDIHTPGVMDAVVALRPVASTILPSVCTTIRVAFCVLRLSPICSVVLPVCMHQTQELLKHCALLLLLSETECTSTAVCIRYVLLITIIQWYSACLLFCNILYSWNLRDIKPI